MPFQPHWKPVGQTAALPHEVLRKRQLLSAAPAVQRSPCPLTLGRPSYSQSPSCLLDALETVLPAAAGNLTKILRVSISAISFWAEEAPVLFPLTEGCPLS